MIRKSELERAVAQGDSEKTLADLLQDLPDGTPNAADFPHVHPDHNLGLTLERMGSSGQSVLPVVSRANVRQLLGVVVLSDVLTAYGVAGPRRAAGEKATA